MPEISIRIYDKRGSPGAILRLKSSRGPSVISKRERHPIDSVIGMDATDWCIGRYKAKLASLLADFPARVNKTISDRR